MQGLGLMMRRNQAGNLEISQLEEGGIAHRSGKVFVGDVVVEIDGIDVTDKTNTEVRNIFQNVVGSLRMGVYRRGMSDVARVVLRAPPIDDPSGRRRESDEFSDGNGGQQQRHPPPPHQGRGNDTNRQQPPPQQQMYPPPPAPNNVGGAPPPPPSSDLAIDPNGPNNNNNILGDDLGDDGLGNNSKTAVLQSRIVRKMTEKMAQLEDERNKAVEEANELHQRLQQQQQQQQQHSQPATPSDNVAQQQVKALQRALDDGRAAYDELIRRYNELQIAAAAAEESKQKNSNVNDALSPGSQLQQMLEQRDNRIKELERLLTVREAELRQIHGQFEEVKDRLQKEIQAKESAVKAATALATTTAAAGGGGSEEFQQQQQQLIHHFQQILSQKDAELAYLGDLMMKKDIVFEEMSERVAEMAWLRARNQEQTQALGQAGLEIDFLRQQVERAKSALVFSMRRLHNQQQQQHSQPLPPNALAATAPTPLMGGGGYLAPIDGPAPPLPRMLAGPSQPMLPRSFDQGLVPGAYPPPPVGPSSLLSQPPTGRPFAPEPLNPLGAPPPGNYGINPAAPPPPPTGGPPSSLASSSSFIPPPPPPVAVINNVSASASVLPPSSSSLASSQPYKVIERDGKRYVEKEGKLYPVLSISELSQSSLTAAPAATATAAPASRAIPGSQPLDRATRLESDGGLVSPAIPSGSTTASSISSASTAHLAGAPSSSAASALPVGGAGGFGPDGFLSSETSSPSRSSTISPTSTSSPRGLNNNINNNTGSSTSTTEQSSRLSSAAAMAFRELNHNVPSSSSTPLSTNSPSKSGTFAAAAPPPPPVAGNEKVFSPADEVKPMRPPPKADAVLSASTLELD